MHRMNERISIRTRTCSLQLISKWQIFQTTRGFLQKLGKNPERRLSLARFALKYTRGAQDAAEKLLRDRAGAKLDEAEE